MSSFELPLDYYDCLLEKVFFEEIEVASHSASIIQESNECGTELSLAQAKTGSQQPGQSRDSLHLN